ncbi:aminoglycoside phosphotransferase [Bradyrhizobium sp. STM 3557]|uniref:aminoglycoside phosphotransferase n=1 Tax=Bradyrhizobium sp. STM 3557 TaxID=578920 RepID=UPI00388FCE18
MSIPQAIQAEHLTAVLRRNGVLGAADVSDVAIESSRDTILSRIIRVSLRYDASADDAPRSLILKTGNPDRIGDAFEAGRREVEFYNEITPLMPADVVPRCFEAYYDPETTAWHLLLEDLTETHVIATQWPLPPSRQQCEAILRAHARLHASWWDNPRLGVSVGTWLDAEALDRRMQLVADDFQRFVDRTGDLLSQERRQLYERLFSSAPRLLQRYHSHRNLTIAQGDAHVWNAFLPREEQSGDVRLFDWDGWRLDVGSRDLAYMIALHWYPDRRKAMERSLLDAYHNTLVACGVQGYDRSALEGDYRLSVLWQITTPVWQAVNNIPAVIWWNGLERIMLAVDDLDCRSLLT